MVVGEFVKNILNVHRNDTNYESEFIFLEAYV